jgi:hypothetical protein
LHEEEQRLRKSKDFTCRHKILLLDNRFFLFLTPFLYFQHYKGLHRDKKKGVLVSVYAHFLTFERSAAYNSSLQTALIEYNNRKGGICIFNNQSLSKAIKKTKSEMSNSKPFTKCRRVHENQKKSLSGVVETHFNTSRADYSR